MIPKWQIKHLTNNQLINIYWPVSALAILSLLLIVATLVRGRGMIWRWNGVRRPRHRTRLLCMGIVVWTTPTWVRRLAIFVARRRLLLDLWRRVWSPGGRWYMVRSWQLLRWAIRRGSISTHGWLLRRLVKWCLGTRVDLWLWTGSLSLMAHWRVVVAVWTCGFRVLEGETCHLPLDIFNHFPTLDVSSHYKVTTLLLHIRYCVLFQCKRAYFLFNRSLENYKSHLNPTSFFSWINGISHFG